MVLEFTKLEYNKELEFFKLEFHVTFLVKIIHVNSIFFFFIELEFLKLEFYVKLDFLKLEF